MLLFRKLITITCFIALAYVKRFLNGHSRTLPRWNINIIQWINEFNPTNLLWLIARNESEETYLQASVLPLHFLSSVFVVVPFVEFSKFLTNWMKIKFSWISSVNKLFSHRFDPFAWAENPSEFLSKRYRDKLRQFLKVLHWISDSCHVICLIRYKRNAVKIKHHLFFQHRSNVIQKWST